MTKTTTRLFSLVFTLVIFQNAILAQADSTSKANVLLHIEQALCNALPGDSATWSRYLDAGWHAVTEDGEGTDRGSFLHGFAAFSPGVAGHINVIRPVCLFRGNMAVVHYVADEYETVFGQQLHTTYAACDTWYQTGNDWRMISMQIFEIPQLPKAVSVSMGDLKKITGLYELTENKTAEVRLRNDSLFLIKANRPAEQLYAETQNVFFIKNNSRGRMLFLRDDAGKKIMVERRNGQDLVWKLKADF